MSLKVLTNTNQTSIILGLESLGYYVQKVRSAAQLHRTWLANYYPVILWDTDNLQDFKDVTTTINATVTPSRFILLGPITDEVISLLSTHADDACGYDVGILELHARINRQAVSLADAVRSTINPILGGKDVFNVGPIQVNPTNLTLTFPNGHQVPVSISYVALLNYIAQRPHELIPFPTLRQFISKSTTCRSINQHLYQLRKLFSANNISRDLILTQGYEGIIFKPHN